MNSERALHYFYEISKIPRCPDHMGKISEYLMQFGHGLGLDCSIDAYENVIIRKPATPGFEKDKPVMLQAHMDMVCEKDPGVSHDFLKDPIEVFTEAGKVRAKGTTLGADDGIGIAYIMAILESTSLAHPEIEAVFTSNEETDMRGAANFDMTKIKSRYIFNLDAEAVMVSGCGETEAILSVPVNSSVKEKDFRHYRIDFHGLRGGHSGVDATKERGNAIALLGRVLLKLSNQKLDFSLTGIQGGSEASTAIPRSAACTLAVKEQDHRKFLETVKKETDIILEEYRCKNPDMEIQIDAGISELPIWDKECTKKIIYLLNFLPEGVISRNFENDSYMGNCCNIGIVRKENEQVHIYTLIRGYRKEKKEVLRDKIEALSTLLDVPMKITRDVPHWERRCSEVLDKLLKEVYPGEFQSMQASAECGYFVNQDSHCVAVGIGAPLYNAHSPEEFFLLEEFEEYWEKLVKLLGKLHL